MAISCCECPPSNLKSQAAYALTVRDLERLEIQTLPNGTKESERKAPLDKARWVMPWMSSNLSTLHLLMIMKPGGAWVGNVMDGHEQMPRNENSSEATRGPCNDPKASVWNVPNGLLWSDVKPNSVYTSETVRRHW